MPAMLDVQDREHLIQQVRLLLRNLREQTPAKTLPQTMRMITPVLAHLKHRSLAATLTLMEYPHASDTSQQHWIEMLSQVKPFLSEIADTYPDERRQQEAGLYALGWLHRLSRIIETEQDNSHTDRPQGNSRAERFQRDDSRGYSNRQETSGHSRREEALTKPPLPPDEPLQNNAIAAAFSRLQQEDQSVPKEADLSSELPSEATDGDAEQGKEDTNARPDNGKHQLWVTALPGARPRIITEWDERVTCYGIQDYKIPDTAKYLREDGGVDLMCLAEVTYKNGKADSARFIRWVEQADLED